MKKFDITSIDFLMWWFVDVMYTINSNSGTHSVYSQLSA